jgi:hypothetical protein
MYIFSFDVIDGESIWKRRSLVKGNTFNISFRKRISIYFFQECNSTFIPLNSKVFNKSLPIESSDGRFSVKIGNLEWMLKHEHEVPENIIVRMEEHEEKGETVVLVCVDGKSN